MSGEDVYIFGAGGIGSFATIALAPRHRIYICDFDIVEPKNVANQIYLKSDAGTKKVDVLTQLYGAEKVVAFDDDKKMFAQMKKNPHPNKIIILATDSIGTRKVILDGIRNALAADSSHVVFIDARTNGSISNVYEFSKKCLSQYITKIDEELAIIESMSKDGDKATSCRTRGNDDIDNTSGMRTALMIFEAIERGRDQWRYNPAHINTFMRGKFSRSEISWSK